MQDRRQEIGSACLNKGTRESSRREKQENILPENPDSESIRQILGEEKIVENSLTKKGVEEIATGLALELHRHASEVKKHHLVKHQSLLWQS